MDVLVGGMLKGLQSLHLTLWLFRDVCCTDKASLLSLVRWWWGQLRHLQQQKYTSNAEKNGPDGVIERVFQKMLFFLVHLFMVRLAWCTIGI